jgi:hypothetical protein
VFPVVRSNSGKSVSSTPRMLLDVKSEISIDVFTPP